MYLFNSCLNLCNILKKRHYSFLVLIYKSRMCKFTKLFLHTKHFSVIFLLSELAVQITGVLSFKTNLQWINRFVHKDFQLSHTIPCTNKMYGWLKPASSTCIHSHLYYVQSIFRIVLASSNVLRVKRNNNNNKIFSYSL